MHARRGHTVLPQRRYSGHITSSSSSSSQLFTGADAFGSGHRAGRLSEPPGGGQSSTGKAGGRPDGWFSLRCLRVRRAQTYLSFGNAAAAGQKGGRVRTLGGSRQANRRQPRYHRRLAGSHSEWKPTSAVRRFCLCILWQQLFHWHFFFRLGSPSKVKAAMRSGSDKRKGLTVHRYAGC